MTEDTFESLAHMGTSPRPKEASLLEEILPKGFGEMGNCPVPNELWDEIVPEGLPAHLRGVRLPKGKGYPSPGGDAGGAERAGGFCRGAAPAG